MNATRRKSWTPSPVYSLVDLERVQQELNQAAAYTLDTIYHDAIEYGLLITPFNRAASWIKVQEWFEEQSQT